jgi:hypothetical protein
LDEPPALLLVLPEPFELEEVLGAAVEPEAPLPALWFEPAPVVPVEPLPVPLEAPELVPVAPEVVVPGAAVVAPAAKPAALKPPALALDEAPIE